MGSRGWALIAAPLLVLGACETGAVDASSRPEEAAPADDTNPLDFRLVLSSLQALMHDNLLASVNLGVTAHDHVVTVWGPVTSASLARHAQDVLRQVPGVGGVVSEIDVVPAGETTDPLELALRSRGPRTTIAGAPPTQPPASILDWAEDFGPPPGQERLWLRPSEALASVTPAGPKRPAEATQPGRALGQVVALGPPRGNTARPVETVFKAPVVLMPPVSVQPPATDLARAIEQLRQGDVHFRGIRVEVRGRTVHLRGTVSPGEDLVELAQAIGRLPGVDRVVLEDIRTAARP